MLHGACTLDIISHHKEHHVENYGMGIGIVICETPNVVFIREHSLAATGSVMVRNIAYIWYATGRSYITCRDCCIRQGHD